VETGEPYARSEGEGTAVVIFGQRFTGGKHRRQNALAVVAFSRNQVLNTIHKTFGFAC